MAVVDVCRVSVRALSLSVAADLALPSRVELGEVLPCVVELVGERPEAAERWTLSRMDGSVLDESMTLDQNGVRDGDVLRLGIADQTSEEGFFDVRHYVAAATESSDCDAGWSRLLGALAFLWSTGVAATALVWPANSATGLRGVVAAVLAIAATAGAAVASRLDAEPLPTLTLGATAVAFGSVAGFLMVPGGPAPPNWLLAAAVCSATSLVLLHVTSGGSTVYVAIGALSTIWAIAAAIVTVWPAPTATMGAVLAAVSLAMLGAAARITVFAAGLSPRMPSAGESPTDDGQVPGGVCVARAERAHRTLTGLLAGFSLSAASGAVLVAVGRHDESVLRCATFTAVVATALILRVSQQVGAVRSASVLLAGLVSATATFTVVASMAPRYDPFACLIIAVLGAGTLIVTRTDVSSRLSPFARRGIEVVDFVAYAAVVPLACWVGNLFGFVRGLGLS